MADKKDTLTVEFERLQGKINTLFKPIYDPIDEFFFELVAKFQKAGVDFLEVNNVKKTAIAKHSNYYEYPERRYAVVVNDKNKVKFYELEFSNSDVDKSAKEIAQKEFEDLTISTYLKPNPLQSKEDQEEDKDPGQPEEEGSKKKEDKDSINKDKPTDHPEIKKDTVEYGETLAPKSKLNEKIKKALEEATFNTPEDSMPYTGSVGNVGPLEAKKKLKLPEVVEIPEEVIQKTKSGEETAVTDYLSDKYSWLVSSVNIKHADGKWYAVDIKWDTSESRKD